MYLVFFAFLVIFVFFVFLVIFHVPHVGVVPFVRTSSAPKPYVFGLPSLRLRGVVPSLLTMQRYEEAAP